MPRLAQRYPDLKDPADIRAAVDLEELCEGCGHSHGIARRLQVLRRYDVCPMICEIAEDFPCLYGDGDAAKQRLYRDWQRKKKLQKRSAA